MADLNYHHLRYFWAVAHDGNLTRTAARLNTSQSALSVQIRQLEARLGHTLFERRGRQLHLTEAGRIALDHADAIFAAGEDLLGTLQHSNRIRKVLRVGALATLSRNFQISVLRPLFDAEVDIALRSGTAAELLRSLEALSLDVIILNQPPTPQSGKTFVSHRLAEQHVSLVGTPSRVGPGRTLRDILAFQPAIVPTAESGIRVGFDALVATLGVVPRIAAEADDMAMVRLLAREGVGVAIVPPIVVKDELASGTLIEACRLPGITETYFAVTKERRFPNPSVKLLLDVAAAGAGAAVGQTFGGSPIALKEH